MRKLRERLNNKKGFTLVELIVVIVIILILAAVLIPNVMRYIQSARESAFQSEASGYLTEIQGYEAEHFAKYDADLPNGIGSFAASTTEATNQKTGEGAVYALTAYDDKLGGNVTVTQAATHTNVGSTIDDNSIAVTVYKGAVIGFSYTDSNYYVDWQQGTGWTNVQKK